MKQDCFAKLAVTVMIVKKKNGPNYAGGLQAV